MKPAILLSLLLVMASA